MWRNQPSYSANRMLDEPPLIAGRELAAMGSARVGNATDMLSLYSVGARPAHLSPEGLIVAAGHAGAGDSESTQTPNRKISVIVEVIGAAAAAHASDATRGV